MKLLYAAVTVSLTILPLATATMDLVLSERVMGLSKAAAKLSALAYDEDPPGDAYDHFGFYDAEPDQAIVAKKNGYCYGAFRGTTLTWDDWQQNLVLGKEEVCHDNPEGGESCCSTRQGFWDAYNTVYRSDMEKALRECAKDCVNKDECVVLTGHSQGGAIAAVAGIYLADLNPYVITFGQPPTIEAPCPLITSDRWYRFVNTKAVESSLVGIAYDPIPFSPGFGADSWGHMILLSEDSSGVAYIGLDAQDNFGPLNVMGFEAHSMIGSDYPGYLDRIESLMSVCDSGTYPVVTHGYVAGTLCSEDVECASEVCGKETRYSFNRCIGTSCEGDSECDSGRCDAGVCAPKLGSCMVCDEDSDCIHGHCSSQFRCSGEGGLMDNDCSCHFSRDCTSGRCEGFTSPVCEAQLGAGAYCNESSDCKSGSCSWKFHCSGGGDEASISRSVVARSIDWDDNTSKSIDLGVDDSDEDKVAEEVTVLDGDVEEKLSKLKVTPVSVALGLALLAGAAAYWYNLKKRRLGYEQVPATLNV